MRSRARPRPPLSWCARTAGWLAPLSLALGVPACGDDGGGTATDSASAGPTTNGATTGDGTSETGSTSEGATSEGTGSTSDTGTEEFCLADPPPEALRRPGPQDGGPALAVGGRALTPAGPNTILDGFPSGVAVHPLGNVVYISSTGREDRRLYVLDLETQAIVQDLDRGESFYGLELAPDGGRLYATGGASDLLEYYDLEVDGTATKAGEVNVTGYPSGLALSPDGALLWVGTFEASRIVELETATMTEVRTFVLPHPVWDVVHASGPGELYASDLGGEGIAVVDLATGEVTDELELPTSPAGMVVDPAGARVWAAVSGADRVAAIDTSTHEVVLEAPVAELDYVDMEGAPLANSNVNALSYDDVMDRVYVTRGADNAVSVLDGTTLELLGAIPASWYPSGVALSPDASTLVIAEGKGGGVGPNDGESAKQRWRGSVTFVDLPGLDLADATDTVTESFSRPVDVFPFECDDFPIPTRPEQTSPIEHVVLIVKENKTFDCVFGDLDPNELDVDVDPSLLRWGETITPNLHELARRYTISDSFFAEAPNSNSGHLYLTATHLTEFAERVYLEDGDLAIDEGYPILPAALPDVGNFFTHLMDHDVDLRVYGEIVGMLAESKTGKGSVFQHSDAGFPGGTFVNYDIKDEDKALYVAGRIQSGYLASFTYLLLPNDHTVGTTAGKPTPESMVADNDYAVGLIVDAVSKSPFWESSAIFIVQDDPQGCDDHVDALRAFAIVVSPWARRGYVSHAHASFLSVFATLERVLGVPPLGRPDAAAAPLWDMFTPDADFTPYDVIPRQHPEETNSVYTPGATRSAKMDFSGPDLEPELGPLLDAYRLWRLGSITRAEAERRIAAPRLTAAQREALEEEAREEREEYEEALEAVLELEMLGERR
ncbi:MAG: hypothetical protein H6713_38425 [Myxococcales bacterium]|nr:hypothetical protein [Myxococcales bacterium]MCB9755844.1 hypothetical protein [Myxococcales bacterium]